MEISPIASLDAGEHVLGLSWSHDGARCAITPAEGPILVANAQGAVIREFPGHGFGNGCAKFHPAADALATCGTNGAIRIYPGAASDAKPMEVTLGKDWIERVEWSPDGARLAAASGRRLVIFDGDGRIECEVADHKSTICDLAWNPCRPGEIAAVCDGGATMWQLGPDERHGETAPTEPFARFDWGGASLLAVWSPDGRWLVTGDQTPSVHLYDFTRDYPLHIQGYETKVKALAFNSASRSLATGGGRLVTIWPCTGRKGPEGVTPKQLEGHNGECVALAWRRGSDLLASGGTDGSLLLFEPGASARPRARYDAGSAVGAIAWHPTEPRLAIGTEHGTVELLAIDLASK